MKCQICEKPLNDKESNVIFVCICMRCFGFMEKSDVRQAEEMVNLSNKITEMTYTMKKIKEFSTNLLERYEGD